MPGSHPQQHSQGLPGLDGVVQAQFPSCFGTVGLGSGAQKSWALSCSLASTVLVDVSGKPPREMM